MSKIKSNLKLTLISLIISLFIIPSFAGAQVYTIHETIDHVEYDSNLHYYSAFTPETSTGFWYLDLFPSNDSTMETKLNESLKGKSITIVYDDNNSKLNTDYWELLQWDFDKEYNQEK
jgi:hypothetical protein